MSADHPLLASIRRAAAPYGLNLIAAIPADRYDAIAPPAMRARSLAPKARSIVVIGNGGGAFWNAFNAHADAHSGWRDRAHPLDDFTRELIENAIVPAVKGQGVNYTTAYPFVGEATLNFIGLGKLAGLGGPSILGVLIHPVYGPWIAFRAALLLDVSLDQPGDALDFDPCPRCLPRSCIAACPASAVNFPVGWDIPRCLTHRVEVEADCASRCHARVACVIGPEHRYPDDELEYHHRRALSSMRPYYEAHFRPTHKSN
jgi:epoxyqueuosine reductase QueG